MKTKLTKDIEKALFYYTKANEQGIYGAFEVTLGMGYGLERADYITMNNTNEFRCYEIKSSKQDFFSTATLSFVGDFNYFVMPQFLYEALESNLIGKYAISGIGILLYDEISRKIIQERAAKRKAIRIGDKTNLMHCMVRSLSRLTIKET